jgi:hypothetical protein
VGNGLIDRTLDLIEMGHVHLQGEGTPAHRFNLLH